MITSLLISSRGDISVKKNGSQNQKLNRLLSTNCVYCHHTQTRLKLGRNPLEQLLYGKYSKYEF